MRAMTASIIVLFLEGSPWIERCMDSLRQRVPASLAHEVIVLANGVAADVALPFEDEGDVRVLRSRVNLGFGGGCNWAARHATGDYLVFLNDDATVEEGWLQGLVDTIESDQRVGAVGSVVLTPGRNLEEAGRVVWSDGVSHPVGSNLAQAKAQLPPVREVDYCSGCSLLVRRSAWETVGGFDDRYFPAYYEDVDLSLSLRVRGWSVVCSSASRVVHQRSVSTSVLWRRFLGLRNHGAFVDKWQAALPFFDGRPRDEPTHTELERAVRRAQERRVALYHRFGMPSASNAEGEGSGGSEWTAASNPAAPDKMALLEEEVAHLEAALRLKDEYIAHLRETSPQMEAALQRLLSEEQRNARRRERVQQIPLVGVTAAWLKRRVRRHQQP
jgi:GT2 family glycosyltransferase